MTEYFMLFGKEVKRGPAVYHPITGRRMEPLPKPPKPNTYAAFICDGKAEIERAVFDSTRWGA